MSNNYEKITYENYTNDNIINDYKQLLNYELNKFDNNEKTQLKNVKTT